MWETCGFPPRPLLATSPGIPLPFQSRAPPHPPGVLVFQQKLRFRNTRTCRHGIAWRGDQTKRFVFTLPAVPPGRGLGASQVVPAPRQSLRRRAGVRTKGNTLVLTSCRPPCGDGCVRPPVPRASARGRGGDSGVWKWALKGGQRPHNRPLSPARRAQGERHGKKGRKRKDAGWSNNEQHHAPPRPPGVLVFQQKLRFRNTRTCRHGIAWRGTPKPHVMLTPFPPYNPTEGLGVLRSGPHPGNPSDGGPRYARRVISLS